MVFCILLEFPICNMMQIIHLLIGFRSGWKALYISFMISFVCSLTLT